MARLTLGSLFDGSGGFPLGGLLSGITPVWASEIEPFPIRVTTKRLPFMKHYGDVSRMDGGKIEPVDIITFGSPCQDMSVAGKRAGLDGSRSNLFYEAIRIVKEMRCATDGKYPRYIVWENVPGAFSSNKGADFQSVLEAICSVKGGEIHIPRPEKWTNAGEILADSFSVAWRVLDAQYWGVPQRRKRIYLVADFAGGSAGKILFESEGVSGYTPQGFHSWEGAVGAAEEGAYPSGIGIDGYNGAISDNAATLGENCGMSTGGNGVMVLNDQGGDRMDVMEDVVATLRAGTVPAAVYENHSQDTRYTGPLETAPTVNAIYGMGGNNQPFVVETPRMLKIRSDCEGEGKGALIQNNKSATLGCNNDPALFAPKVYVICSKDSNAMKSENPKIGSYEAETSRCLTANGGNPTCNQGGMAVVAVQGSMIGREEKNGPQGSGVNEDVSFTLNTADRHVVAYCMTTDTYTQVLEEQSPTLMERDYKGPPIVNDTDPDYIVRRLTPTECARLQGFPDWWCSNLETDEPTEEEIEFWTAVFETHRSVMGTSSKPKSRNQIIKWLKNPHTDSAEYKMWGNGVALPNVYFVLSGIVYYAQTQEIDR